MINNYSKACTETLKIINLLSIEDCNKIPENVIKILDENKDESYVFEYDYTKDLMNQNIENLTKGIISNLYKNYIASNDEKKEITKIESTQLKEEEKLKRQKYDTDNIFLNNQKNEHEGKVENDTLPIENKKLPWYKNILKKILINFDFFKNYK